MPYLLNTWCCQVCAIQALFSDQQLLYLFSSLPELNLDLDVHALKSRSKQNFNINSSMDKNLKSNIGISYIVQIFSRYLAVQITINVLIVFLRVLSHTCPCKFFTFAFNCFWIAKTMESPRIESQKTSLKDHISPKHSSNMHKLSHVKNLEVWKGPK